MKIYMDPNENKIINLTEVQFIVKETDLIIGVYFKKGKDTILRYSTPEECDREFRVIFHEMHG